MVQRQISEIQVPPEFEDQCCQSVRSVTRVLSSMFVHKNITSSPYTLRSFYLCACRPGPEPACSAG
eukprot:scaffold22024_cov19-Prasinocladus_malaysianus.AAC.1